MEEKKRQSQEQHHMGWRGKQKNYCWPGVYHITINVAERRQQPLGVIAGDVSKPDGDPQAPHVVLSEVGQMVEEELTHSISTHYPMVEVQDYVIMPDHLHFLLVVRRRIVSSSGKETHLGQVIAGFKKGCNRRYWEITGKQPPMEGQGKPAPAGTATATPAGTAAATPAGVPLPVVSPQGQIQGQIQGQKVPSTATTGRPPLFAYGYVDVMPLQEGQLERQRQYIRNNPRYRLLRMKTPNGSHITRGGMDTAVSIAALKGYLRREGCEPFLNDATWTALTNRLLMNGTTITCDSYGNRQLIIAGRQQANGNHHLMSGTLLPVVCHRKDAALFSQQKERCLRAAAAGAVLVSAQIATKERDIIRTAIDGGFPVVIVIDNGLPPIYHPSEERTDLCSANKLLLVTPWKYAYRRSDEQITTVECKTMNCVVQALCRRKDSWWKESLQR
jgi:REP element-mobilizing transposase RayT